MKGVIQHKLLSLLTATLFLLFAFPIFGQSQIPAQTSDPKVENLAFKILQKQAAEYEEALSTKIAQRLSTYIPEDRFHLSVRVFWNPAKLEQIKMKNEALNKPSGKLPGFQVFVRNEEQSLDYYLGAGSVMRLKVEVLIDETLPKQYTEFIYELVPIQARFVPERGDSVQVTPIPFPESKVKTFPDQEIPLSDDTNRKIIDSINNDMKEISDIKPTLLHPVLQRYVSEYEEYIKQRLLKLIGEYVDPKKFLLDLKFFWNEKELESLKSQISQGESDDKVKLPGFTLYLEGKNNLYNTISNSRTLVQMDISVMLDKNVPKDVAPFLEKLIPISIKLIPERGDKLTIFTGHFPKAPGESRVADREGGQRSMSYTESEDDIVKAFQEGNFREGITLADLLLSKTNDPDRQISLLKKKGSLHLMLQEKQQARDIWQKVQKMAPDDTEIKALLEFLK